jgi:hypothetical protein
VPKPAPDMLGNGASVDIEQHPGILPRNRGTDVHVETPAPAPDTRVTTAPPPPDQGTIVEEHSEATVHQR